MERACIDLLVVCQEKSFATTLTYIRYLFCIYKRTSMSYFLSHLNRIKIPYKIQSKSPSEPCP